MTSKLTLLGTGTCQIEKHRMASSVLIELGDLRVVYDFGRGITQRLVELGLRNDDIRHVVLSHFHPDHLSDLIPFLQAACWSRTDPRSTDLHIYGPKGLKTQMMRLLGLFEVDNISRDTFDVHLHEVRSESFAINRFEFRWISLPPAGNHGLRFTVNGMDYCLTGDSYFHDAEVNFLRGASLAVIDSGHISDDEILELAVKSQAKKIVCSHLYRELDETVLNLAAKSKGYSGTIVVGKDLMEFPLG